MSSPINQLKEFGQSFWYDNIQRSMIHDGTLEKMIHEDDLRGITSNPAIFEKAINGSTDYDSTLARLALDQPNLSGRDYFYQLAIEDIKNAADLLMPVYEKTQALDGYVSIEVSPDLAYDTDATISEAREIFARIGKPNVMIKVPATAEGVPAVEQLITDGININATLLFSPVRYIEIAQAYIKGLKKRSAKGHSVDNIASVASFFVSRVDNNLEPQLETRYKHADDAVRQKLDQLKGNIGIINAKCAYMQYQALYGSDFNELKEAGARPQRLLWASTGTKNPEWSDVLYVDSLIGENTVNTIPPSTLEAFKDHGQASASLSHRLDEAQDLFDALSEANIDVASSMQQLEDEGVKTFAQAFDKLTQAIEEKINNFRDRQNTSAA